MLDEILNMVKEHLGGHPDIAGAITPEQENAVHTEIANHLSNIASNPAATAPQAQSTGILGQLENAVANGGTAVSAIEGGLISSLTSKFGLPPSVTGAISGMLPGLLQKFTQKNAQQ
ncbi:MAG: hypothetical protein JSU03_11810 [Bacteroidetes bacterium]|nr:hypothetical protein [Bacteroidota bacterium]MBS1757956.1 hypothetical protein [Bacteroidota bacterium]